LETKEGNISESKAIEVYLCRKYKPEYLGNTTFEKAKVNQWIEFACAEINECIKNIIYPIFGWNDFDKELFDKSSLKMKEIFKILEQEFSKKEFIIGKQITLADIILFRFLRFLMMLKYPEKMMKSTYPNILKWFEKIMNSPEAIEAYGRTILCKIPIKPFNGRINRNVEQGVNKEKGEKTQKIENVKESEKNEKKKKNDKNIEKGKKKEIVKEVVKEEYTPGLLELSRFNIKPIENNPLDALPETKFDLEKFKKDFVNSTNKKGMMKKFWKEYDPEGYSIWYIEYNNEPNECITLFRTVIIKGDILIQLQYFKKYCFGVLGVYGSDGDYKIRGCLLWRGKEIPDEIKNINCYNKLNLRKIDTNEKKDQQLVHDYWTKIKENEKVFKKNAIDTRYFV
jgi:elongation factor 1-gamma